MEGKYATDHVLMVGDAPGDHEASTQNGVLYFPIIPGRETESWSLMRSAAAEKFHTGTFAGEYMDGLLEQFYNVLKDEPNW